MALYKYNGDDRRRIIFRLVGRGRRFGRLMKVTSLTWVLFSTAIFLILFAFFGLRFLFPGNIEDVVSSSRGLSIGVVSIGNGIESSQEVQVSGVGINETRITPPLLQGVLAEQSGSRIFRSPSRKRRVQDKHVGTNSLDPKFGGHQTLVERERSFYARDQTVHCGFVKGPPGFPSTGFDLDEKDKACMRTCKVAVSSCIFGNSDFLRRPTSKKISEFSKKNVCFVMFVDEQTVSKLSSDGHVPDGGGYVGLWRVVVVRNLPYKDMRRTGKVPKFLSHRLFPSASYSIWIDSKLRLNADPMLIIEYFLWRLKAEYAISNHYDRHCVWEEVLQNKRLNKYNHTAIDEQFQFYQSDGLIQFDPSDPNRPLPSYVPEGSFIVRAHTAVSNLFSCLWFNEVDRFTSRDQLSFAYTFLKLRRLNPDQPFRLHMFKDCERRSLTKLFRHRTVSLPPTAH